MEEVPADILQYDIQTMPREDPKVAEAIRKNAEKDAKLHAAEEKAQAAAVKKATGTTTRAKSAPVASQPSQVDAKAARQREIKLQKIRLYFSKLGHKITVKEPKTLPKSDEEIDALLASIETQLHSDGGIEKAGLFYVSGCASIEQITQVFNPLGWQLSGPSVSFAATVAQNKAQWEELVTEFAISNAEWFMVGPGKRLIATTVQMILAVDAANKARTASNKPADDKLKEEAHDL